MSGVSQYEFDKRISQLEADLRAVREALKALEKQEPKEEKRGPGRPKKVIDGNS